MPSTSSAFDRSPISGSLEVNPKRPNQNVMLEGSIGVSSMERFDVTFCRRNSDAHFSAKFVNRRSLAYFSRFCFCVFGAK